MALSRNRVRGMGVYCSNDSIQNPTRHTQTVNKNNKKRCPDVCFAVVVFAVAVVLRHPDVNVLSMNVNEKQCMHVSLVPGFIDVGISYTQICTKSCTQAAHLHQKTFNFDDYCFVLFNHLYVSRRKRHNGRCRTSLSFATRKYIRGGCNSGC